MRDTDADWEKFGRRDPYWAVLTEDEYRREHLDEAARAAFFANGEGTIAHIIGVLGRHFGCPDRFDATLDFGCGVGRLLLPLARRSRIAVGLDVSSSMLAECRRNASAFGIQNAILRQTDDSLSQAREYIGNIEFLTSMLVLQHIPPSRGILILDRLLGLLRPTGFGCIQLVTGTRPVRDTTSIPGPVMEMNPYDLNAVISILHARGIREVFCSLADHDGLVGVTIYFRR